LFDHLKYLDQLRIIFASQKCELKKIRPKKVMTVNAAAPVKYQKSGGNSNGLSFLRRRTATSNQTIKITMQHTITLTNSRGSP